MTTILDLQMFLHNYFSLKVTVHLGYIVSLFLINASLFRIDDFKNYILSIENPRRKYLYFVLNVMMLFWVFGRIMYWSVMMDCIFHAELDGGISDNAIPEIITGSEMWLKNIRNHNWRKMLAYYARNSTEWIFRMSAITVILLSLILIADYIIKKSK